MRLKLNVTDNGNSWLVIGGLQSEEVITGVENIYEVTSWEIYAQILEAITKGKSVYIPKNLSSELTLDDITIADDDNPLGVAKRCAINSIKDYIYNCRLTKLSVIQYYQFTMLNNYFANMGFFITNENREEQYLAIVTKISEMENQEESDAIITKLEMFLNSIDALEEFNGYLTKMNSAIHEIDQCETIEDITKVVDDIKEFFK